MLPKQQGDSLFFFLDVLRHVLAESHCLNDLKKLKHDLNTALAMLERDFPISIQVITFN